MGLEVRGRGNGHFTGPLAAVQHASIHIVGAVPVRIPHARQLTVDACGNGGLPVVGGRVGDAPFAFAASAERLPDDVEAAVAPALPDDEWRAIVVDHAAVEVRSGGGANVANPARAAVLKGAGVDVPVAVHARRPDHPRRAVSQDDCLWPEVIARLRRYGNRLAESSAVELRGHDAVGAVLEAQPCHGAGAVGPGGDGRVVVHNGVVADADPRRRQ